jgi:uncharacterized lipoprotein NlpE involved in copper resistance
MVGEGGANGGRKAVREEALPVSENTYICPDLPNNFNNSKNRITMKKIVFLISAMSLLIFSLNSCSGKKQAQSAEPEAIVAIPTADNSYNSIEWEGEYKGVIPCADCEGIEVSLTLNDDLTYRMSQTYIGKGGEPVLLEGSFKWDEEGSNITLDGIREGAQPNKYKVGEYRLFQLDMNGEVIDGELADKYILEKVMN